MSFDYPAEDFSADERALLAPFVTSLDEPVFCLQGLPEAVKGAAFARYSRYPGTLRRLLLDEFSEVLDRAASLDSADEGSRAADVYERVFVGFGDDSVAQLGGVHVACEWTSNILTKVLQRPRLGAYLEQSTRYIAFDQPIDGRGRYRYYSDDSLGSSYRESMDSLFAVYSELLHKMTGYYMERFPQGDEPEGPWRRAVRAKALDACRGLLPAASLSHMGIYATGQTYEQLVLHLLAHPLPEAQECGQRMLTQLKTVVPSFLARVERPDRGGAWVQYLRQRKHTSAFIADQMGLRQRTDQDHGPQVRLLESRGSEEQLLAALLFEESLVEARAGADAVAELTGSERREVLRELVGTRENRRHRPGRGLEALSYRFEVVSDYGAFRDLQRHRMLTCQWQALTPDLGYEVPEDIEAAGMGDRYRAALDSSAATYEQLRGAGHEDAAAYALSLGYRIRYALDLNAREAMHLIELRSGREGHPSYRAVTLAMHEAIAGIHPTVAEAMTHVDHETDPRLERIAAELRNDQRGT